MAGGERAGVPSRLGAVFPHFCPIRPSVGVASDPRAVPDFASHHSATSPRVFVCVCLIFGPVTSAVYWSGFRAALVCLWADRSQVWLLVGAASLPPPSLSIPS